MWDLAVAWRQSESGQVLACLAWVKPDLPSAPRIARVWFRLPGAFLRMRQPCDVTRHWAKYRKRNQVSFRWTVLTHLWNLFGDKCAFLLSYNVELVSLRITAIFRLGCTR